MKLSLKITLLVHVVIAFYCTTCGVLDSAGYGCSWMMPNVAVFYTLFASAIIMPLLVLILAFKFMRSKALLIAGADLILSIVQILFGLAPMICGP